MKFLSQNELVLNVQCALLLYHKTISKSKKADAKGPLITTCPLNTTDMKMSFHSSRSHLFICLHQQDACYLEHCKEADLTGLAAFPGTGACFFFLSIVKSA